MKGGSKTGRIADADLAVDVVERLKEDPITGAFSFGVVAENGIIFFRGAVPPSNAVRARAVSVALGTEGVLEVVDELYPPTSGVY